MAEGAEVTKRIMVVVGQRAILVIPCYNEEKRLNFSRFQSLLERDATLSLLFVDDGSNDSTAVMLTDFSHNERVIFNKLEKNSGKAEAVRQGLLEALRLKPEIIGYADVDFATPEREILRLLGIMRESNYQVLLGSRVQLLGSNIERKWWRHYLGRIFATVASIVLRLRLYDTQCGLKFFRRTSRLEEVLAEPFRTRWVFDVELIGRLISTKKYRTSALVTANFREIPIEAWADIGGSKLGIKSMIRAGLDLIFLGLYGPR